MIKSIIFVFLIWIFMIFEVTAHVWIKDCYQTCSLLSLLDFYEETEVLLLHTLGKVVEDEPVRVCEGGEDALHLPALAAAVPEAELLQHDQFAADS